MIPTVSVIIPNYNHALYLEERINSVLNQTYQNIEVIILDDCSKDNSKEIIEKYKNHEKVKHIVYNKVNGGSTFTQWQKGLELAVGELVWIAESDDYAELNFLETLTSFFKDDEVVLAYSRSLILSEGKENYICTWGEIIKPKIWNSDTVFESKQFLKSFLQFRNIIPNASAAVFRKSEARIVPKMLRMKYAGDWIFWTQLANRGKVGFSSKFLNYFRQHNASTRSVKSYEQETIKNGENFAGVDYANQVLRKAPNLFEKNYAWMIEDWWHKKEVFTFLQTLQPKYPYGFSFYLSTTLVVMFLNSIKKNILFLYHKIQFRTNLRKVFGM